MDLQLAAGDEVTAFDPGFAADGNWQVAFDGGMITGPATEVYPTLWNRTVQQSEGTKEWRRIARWTYG